jgi:hypothetical protein
MFVGGEPGCLAFGWVDVRPGTWSSRTQCFFLLVGYHGCISPTVAPRALSQVGESAGGYPVRRMPSFLKKESHGFRYFVLLPCVAAPWGFFLTLVGSVCVPRWGACSPRAFASLICGWDRINNCDFKLRPVLMSSQLRGVELDKSRPRWPIGRAH